MSISPTPVADTDFPVGGDILKLYANVDGTGGTIRGKPVLTLDRITRPDPTDADPEHPGCRLSDRLLDRRFRPDIIPERPGTE